MQNSNPLFLVSYSISYSVNIRLALIIHYYPRIFNLFEETFDVRFILKDSLILLIHNYR